MPRLGNPTFRHFACSAGEAEKEGFSVIRDFVGHGVGRELHEDPQIPNYGKAGRGPRLVEGMVLAIEPMVAVGTYETETLLNNWTAVTADGKLSAHYENTVAITENGAGSANFSRRRGVEDMAKKRHHRSNGHCCRCTA